MWRWSARRLGAGLCHMPLLRAPGVLQLPSARHTQPVLQEPYARYCDLDEWRLFARPILQGTSKPNPLAESSASPTSETPTEGDGGGWSGNGIARRARVKVHLRKGHLRKGHLRWRTSKRRIGWQAIALWLWLRMSRLRGALQGVRNPWPGLRSVQVCLNSATGHLNIARRYSMFCVSSGIKLWMKRSWSS